MGVARGARGVRRRIALLIAFAIIEGRWARAPLVPLRLFASRSITGSNLVAFGVGAALFSVWYFQSLYLQGVRGMTPLATASPSCRQTLAIVVGAQISSRLMPRLGARPFLVGGPLLISLGLLWMAQVAVSPPSGRRCSFPGRWSPSEPGWRFPPSPWRRRQGCHVRNRD